MLDGLTGKQTLIGESSKSALRLIFKRLEPRASRSMGLHRSWFITPTAGRNTCAVAVVTSILGTARVTAFRHIMAVMNGGHEQLRQ